MAPFRYRVDFSDGTDQTVDCESQAIVRNACTDIMEGQQGLHWEGRQPARVTMLIRDGGQYRATWSRGL